MQAHIYLLIFIITTIFFYIYFKLFHKMKQNYIPGPKCFPIIGTKWQKIEMTKLHEYYEKLNEKYGDVVMEVSGSFPIISIFKREDIEKALNCTSQFPFRPPNEIQSFYRLKNSDRYSSTGITNEQGPVWMNLRAKLSLKTLENRKFYEQFCTELNEICSDFVDVIRSVRNEQNEIKNVHDYIRSISFETNCSFVLGKRGYGSLEGSEKIAKLSDANIKIMESIRDTYYGEIMWIIKDESNLLCLEFSVNEIKRIFEISKGTQFWKYFPTKAYKTFAESEKVIYDIISEIIEKILIDDKENADDNEHTSILEKVVTTDGLDMKDKICGIIGSTEAKAVTIIFLLYHLSEHPEVQETIYNEALSLSEFLTIEDTKKAHYTRAVIYETFRLTPTAPALARILDHDLEFSGYQVKGGTFVLCQNMISCLKESNFAEAKSFKPERWLNAKNEFDYTHCNSSSIVLPFGTGKRACPGKKFAELELVTILITLVRSFKIKYNSPFEKVFKFIMTPKFPVDMIFEDRFE